MKSNNLRVAVITQAPFPQGNVSTMRYTSYLKALNKEGVFTYVLIYTPTRMAAINKGRVGCCDGIKYQYSTLITWNKYDLVNKIYYLIKGLISSIHYLKENKIGIIVLYGDNRFIVHLFYYLYSRFTKKRFIGDRSELPSIKVRKSKIRMFFYGLKQKMFDGIIVMTKQLEKFYHQYSSNNDYIFFLPMTIDSDRFKKVQIGTSDDYIAVVFGIHNRDGLYESLLSYELYRKKGGTYNLNLIGDFDNMPNKKELEAAIGNSNYKSDIHILGKQENDKVPQLLANARILLTTPNFYISGGFPTKLGEYMLSGVPIVATIAGEILDYIVPNEDMLLNNPQDFDGISDSLLMLEKDMALGKLLSTNALNKAKNVFCADNYIDELVNFLSE